MNIVFDDISRHDRYVHCILSSAHLHSIERATRFTFGKREHDIQDRTVNVLFTMSMFPFPVSFDRDVHNRNREVFVKEQLAGAIEQRYGSIRWKSKDPDCSVDRSSSSRYSRLHSPLNDAIRAETEYPLSFSVTRLDETAARAIG